MTFKLLSLFGLYIPTKLCNGFSNNAILRSYDLTHDIYSYFDMLRYNNDVAKVDLFIASLKCDVLKLSSIFITIISLCQVRCLVVDI